MYLRFKDYCVFIHVVGDLCSIIRDDIMIVYEL